MILSRLARTVFPPSRRSMLLAGPAATAPFARAKLQSGDDAETSFKWKTLRDALFKGRAIESRAADFIELETPRRGQPSTLAMREPTQACREGSMLLEVGELREALDDLAQLGAGAHDLLLRRRCHAEQ